MPRCQNRAFNVEGYCPGEMPNGLSVMQNNVPEGARSLMTRSSHTCMRSQETANSIGPGGILVPGPELCGALLCSGSGSSQRKTLGLVAS